MIRFLISTLIVLLPSIASAQGVTVSADSSRLIFSNNVAIELSKTMRKGNVIYQLSPIGVRTFVVQYNFVNGVLELSKDRLTLVQRELTIKDSTINTLQQGLSATNERLLLYSAGYDQLKSVNSAYDKQVKELIAELELGQKNKRRMTRRNFLSGLAVGLAATLVFAVIQE